MKDNSIISLVDQLRKELAGKVLDRESMKRHTSFRIGGLADMMVMPADELDLTRAVAWCRDLKVPWRIIGRGTNLLVKDGRLHEVVINLTGLSQVPRMLEGYQVQATAGLQLAQLIKICQGEGLTGLEFAAGIPGTLGGALFMNAGAHGRLVSDCLVAARGFEPGQIIRTYPRDEIQFDYRKLVAPQGVIWVGATYKVDPEDPRAVREQIVRYLKTRRNSQPLNYPSAGSVFKNPPGDYAGRLIEQAGLKGHRIGDAQISDKHANFIVNRGRARSVDVISLIELAREKVMKLFKTELQLEIQIIGED